MAVCIQRGLPRGDCIQGVGGLHPEEGLYPGGRGSASGGVGRPPPNRIPWDMANERAVRILLECILVKINYGACVIWQADFHLGKLNILIYLSGRAS